ncbi:unnamed protein product [Somion occarium]|uniref:non-specific serine/threonine protein kinase n=1 Tax=Somion occarium TaxID=3059160 RepID=A0ABP1D082_9APHY
MLGTRTKQVFSYGRRGHRIVNVSDDHDQRKPYGADAFIEVENIAYPKSLLTSKSSPVKLAHPLSPSPPPTPVQKPVKRKAVSKTKRSPKTTKTSPARSVRHPLRAFSSNVPGSPAAIPAVRKKMKPKSALGKGTPLAPSSPVVKVDIIVLDNNGRRLSQERRLSRPNVQINSPGAPSIKPTKTKPTSKNVSKPRQKPAVPPKVVKRNKEVSRPPVESHRIIIYDSDEENPLAPFSPVGRKPHVPIILSSDSENEADMPNHSIESPSPQLPKPRKRVRAKKVVLSSPESDVSPHPKPQRVTPSIFPTKDNTLSSPSQQLFKKIAPLPRPAFTSPVLPNQPRNRTPIRARQDRTTFPSPSSPTLTDDDLDLTFDLAELGLSPGTRRQVAASFRELGSAVPAYLQPLLAECSQTTPHEFSAFIEMFPRDRIVHISHDCTEFDSNSAGLPNFQKIGEASYSEVFGIGNVVLKIIPLRDEDAKRSPDTSADLDAPAPSDAKDVLKEIVVTRAMGEMCGGFVKLIRTYVVRGRYPSLLLDLWDEYNERKGSESVRPDSFTASQTYAIIVLPNGGPDLEAYTFAPGTKMGWRQACSIFWQITRALADAEDLVHFEHRDLHWGQILVKNVTTTTSHSTKGKRLTMDDDAHGVRATVIDLGLARMDDGDGVNVRWTPFDEEIFEGEGDYQFDVYRMMKAHNGNSWETYKPLTNVMLHAKPKLLRLPLSSLNKNVMHAFQNWKLH